MKENAHKNPLPPSSEASLVWSGDGISHRDIIIRLMLNDYARRYGLDTPLDLTRFNGLLAAIRQPLATKVEIAVWYGHEPDHLAVN
jgi:hypothetical protein